MGPFQSWGTSKLFLLLFAIRVFEKVFAYNMVSATPSITTRSTISSSNKPSTGVLPAKCIFCDKGRRKLKGKMVYPGKKYETCEKYETAISIRDPATILDDENIQLKVENYEFGKREYLNKSRDHKKEIAK